ncbi:hypothetical protein [Streptomyces sp. NPDC051577]|uniref:hypothetical protein n=1 Tax=Streptomyces sp. NPDC051577 TaxID=3155166 RepID=UPI0034408CE2
MASIASFPVFMRVGGSPEVQIGELVWPAHGAATLSGTRTAIAGLLRTAADAFEHPEQEEAPDAPA